jgi:hypothetical protein
MKILFLFMDGVGLGRDDPQVNPFARAHLPNLENLLEGRKVVTASDIGGNDQAPRYLHVTRLSMFSLDACLGIEGIPQSASGQATLLTGKNVAAMIGAHDGPKPSPEVMGILRQGTIFSKLKHQDLRASLLNAYPERYFKSIRSGHRLPGAIALSALYAGIHLRTAADLFRGDAISVDLTGHGWREQLGLVETPILDPSEAGLRLNALANQQELSLFEYWLSDVAGHQQDMKAACSLLTVLDTALGKLAEQWDDDQGLILVTSDHGNIEDLTTRHHTRNDVPLILIGSEELRNIFITEMNKSRGVRKKFDLTDTAPAILAFFERSR